MHVTNYFSKFYPEVDCNKLLKEVEKQKGLTIDYAGTEYLWH